MGSLVYTHKMIQEVSQKLACRAEVSGSKASEPTDTHLGGETVNGDKSSKMAASALMI